MLSQHGCSWTLTPVAKLASLKPSQAELHKLQPAALQQVNYLNQEPFFHTSHAEEQQLTGTMDLALFSRQEDLLQVSKNTLYG